MKKILSLALAAVLLVGMVFALVSCAGDIADGTYKSENGMEIVVDGNKITVVGVTYKYSVDGNELTMEIDDLDDEVKAQLEEAGMDVDEYIDAMNEKLEPMEYEETADGFKLEGVEYKKQ